MRGHVRKRGAKWAVVVELEPGLDRRRRQKWHSGFRRRKDAERKLAELLAGLEDGTYTEPSRLTSATT